MTLSYQREIGFQPRKLLGQILQEAGLITSAQLNIALILQNRSSNIKLGKIIATQGWLKQQTIDFLAEIFSPSYSHKYTIGEPIGYYFQVAGLLSSEQIESIIKDQKKLGLKFCYVAVLKKFINPSTAEFFINHVVKKVSVSPLPAKSDPPKVTSYKLETMILDNDFYEEISKEDVIFEQTSDDAEVISDLAIQSTPMWIDQ